MNLQQVLRTVMFVCLFFLKKFKTLYIILESESTNTVYLGAVSNGLFFPVQVQNASDLLIKPLEKFRKEQIGVTKVSSLFTLPCK